MERNILRIKTLTNGERVGISVSSEYEEKTDKDYPTAEQKYAEELLNSLYSKEYVLDNVKSLPDGDYPINLFKEVPYAASMVSYGEPTPIHTLKPLLMYTGGNDKN